jgi:hypothetical protein
MSNDIEELTALNRDYVVVREQASKGLSGVLFFGGGGI